MSTKAAATLGELVLLLVAAFPTLVLITSPASIARPREASVATESGGSGRSDAVTTGATPEGRCERPGRIGRITRTRCD